MNFNLKINNLLFLPIILIFFPAFVFWIPFLKGAYLYFFIVLYLCIGTILVLNGKNLVRKFIKITKNTPLKIFFIALLLMTINSIFLMIVGKSSFSNIRSLILQFALFIIPIIFYFVCIINEYISYKNCIRLFLLLFWIILNIGFISYIGQLFNIEIVNTFFDFFANERILSVANTKIEMQVSNYEAFGLPRLDNLFAEPSFYARFLFMFLPFIYAFSQSRHRIVNNKVWNFIIKKTMIPFTLISIILTFSPIYLILTIILTGIYYFNNIRLIIKKYYIYFIIALLIICIILKRVDLSETYLSRIFNTLENIKSFEDFILIEPSFATRVVSYINSICVFLQHPFIGVGFGNLTAYDVMYKQYLSSPVPLTPEIITKTNAILYDTNRVFINRGYLYSLLAENGFFISVLMLYFYIKLYMLLAKIEHIYSSLQIERTYAQGLKGCLAGIFIIMFYNLGFLDLYLYLIVVLSIILIYNCKLLIKDKISQNTKKDIEGM